MNFQTVPDKSVGDIFSQPMWASYIEQNLNLGVMRLLAAPVVLAAPAASIDISSIPATFAHLRVVFFGGTTSTNQYDTLLMRLNADSGTNYFSQYIRGQAATASAAETISSSSSQVGSLPGNFTGFDEAGIAQIDIPNYAGLVQRVRPWVSESQASTGTTTGSQRRETRGGYWDAAGLTAAASVVNEITLLPSAGNFATGSTAFVYGLPT